MLYPVNGEKLEVVIIKKNNKNTYIRIKEDKKIYITTNYFVTKKQIKKLLDENILALQKMLSKVILLKEKENNFYYLGKKYDIIMMKVEKVEIFHQKIYATSQQMLDDWCKSNMREIFQDHLNDWYAKFEESLPVVQLKIRKMKTRWGVCNIRDNSITLNSELIRYDVTKLDYVIIHELSHFIYFNHSKNFWNLVYKYCPDYKRIRKELRS